MSTSNLVSALGAGSGVDIKTLAESLVDAERAPRKERIEAKITASQAKISGYGAIKYALSQLKSAFEGVKDTSDFVSLKATNTQPTAVGVTTTSKAAAGSFDLEVTALAQPQRSVGTFASRSLELNSGSPFWLNLTLAGEAADPIKVSSATPAGMVGAINGAKLGVTAQLIETGTSSVIVVTGPEGDVNDFTLSAVTNGTDGQPTTTAVAGVDFSETSQPASDAVLTLNGQRLTRPSNRVSDALEGVTLELYTTTSGDARLDLQRETGAIKDRMQTLVTAYNEFNDALKILGDRASEVEEFGGALAGESLLSSLRSQVRAMFTSISSTPGSTVTSARHVGLSLDRFGVMKLDSTKLESALQDNFSEVVTMLTADSDNKSVYASTDSGLAGDAFRTLDKMLRTTGIVEQQSVAAGKKIDTYKEDLKRLEARMEKILERYTKQFSVMDDLVGNSNSLRTSLQSSFDGMASMYNGR